MPFSYSPQMARYENGDAVYWGEIAIEEDFKDYVKSMVESYAFRGELSHFELHRFPTITEEQFETVIREHGLKTTEKKTNVPLVHFVYWDRESEYFNTHLSPLFDAAQDRKAEAIMQLRKQQK